MHKMSVAVSQDVHACMCQYAKLPIILCTCVFHTLIACCCGQQTVYAYTEYFMISQSPTTDDHQPVEQKELDIDIL